MSSCSEQCDYNYLKRVYESIINSNNLKMSLSNFEIWFKNDFQNEAKKNKLIETFLSDKEKILKSKMEYLRKMNQIDILKIVEEKHDIINKMNVVSEIDLEEKLKAYYEIIDLVDVKTNINNSNKSNDINEDCDYDYLKNTFDKIDKEDIIYGDTIYGDTNFTLPEFIQFLNNSELFNILCDKFIEYKMFDINFRISDLKKYNLDKFMDDIIIKYNQINVMKPNYPTDLVIVLKEYDNIINSLNNKLVEIEKNEYINWLNELLETLNMENPIRYANVINKINKTLVLLNNEDINNSFGFLKDFLYEKANELVNEINNLNTTYTK